MARSSLRRPKSSIISLSAGRGRSISYSLPTPEIDNRAGWTWECAGDLHQGGMYGDLLAQQLFAEIGAFEQLAKIEARIIY